MTCLNLCFLDLFSEHTGEREAGAYIKHQLYTGPQWALFGSFQSLVCGCLAIDCNFVVFMSSNPSTPPS